MNKKHSQSWLLKVDLLSAICNYELIAQGEELETSAKLRVFVSIIIVTAFKAAIYKIHVFVSCISLP